MVHNSGKIKPDPEGMKAEDEDVDTEEKKGSSRHWKSGVKETNLKRVFRLVFLFLIITFTAAFVGVIAKHDVIPFFTERARELSKHRTREGKVEFNFVQNIEQFPHKNVRLPPDLKPVSYKLNLRVNLTTERFIGKVKIEIICMNSTRYVILHSGDLDLTNVFVSKKQNTKQEEKLVVKRILAYKEHQQLCIELTETLRKGDTYHATLEFKSKISHRLVGFYKSTYTTLGGEKR